MYVRIIVQSDYMPVKLPGEKSESVDEQVYSFLNKLWAMVSDPEKLQEKLTKECRSQPILVNVESPGFFKKFLPVQINGSVWVFPKDRRYAYQSFYGLFGSNNNSNNIEVTKEIVCKEGRSVDSFASMINLREEEGSNSSRLKNNIYVFSNDLLSDNGIAYHFRRLGGTGDNVMRDRMLLLDLDGGEANEKDAYSAYWVLEKYLLKRIDVDNSLTVSERNRLVSLFKRLIVDPRY